MELLENIKLPDIFVAIAFLVSCLIIKCSVGEEWNNDWGTPSKDYNRLKSFTDFIISVIPIVGYFLMCLTGNVKKVILSTLFIEFVIWCNARIRKKALSVWAENEKVKVDCWPNFKIKIAPYLLVLFMIGLTILLFFIIYYFATEHIIYIVKNGFYQNSH